MSSHYKGWIIEFCKWMPVTGKWVAFSRGIRMCAGTEDAIKRIIDQRIKDYPNDGHGNTKGNYNV